MTVYDVGLPAAASYLQHVNGMAQDSATVQELTVMEVVNAVPIQKMTDWLGDDEAGLKRTIHSFADVLPVSFALARHSAVDDRAGDAVQGAERHPMLQLSMQFYLEQLFLRQLNGLRRNDG